MRKRRAPRAGAQGATHRKHRARPVPKWLKDPKRMNAVAHSRCMMLLSVLSGETPVSDAIAQAKISRGTYYQLETRALNAMLSALNPLSTVKRRSRPDLSAHRIEALTERIRLLEQDKRRMRRLLMLARKAKEPSSMDERLARRRLRARLGLTRRGPPPSQVSMPMPTRVTSPSIPTKPGGNAS
jgi:hypothetical protein